MKVTEHQKAIKRARERSTNYQVLKQAQCEKCLEKIGDTTADPLWAWVLDGVCVNCRKPDK